MKTISYTRHQKTMIALCLLLIVLQAADAGSTYLALETGRTEEKNKLLVSFASASGWPVIWVVVAAKFVVVAFFGMAITRTRPTPLVLGALTGLVMYCGYIVSMNFYWAWVLV